MEFGENPAKLSQEVRETTKEEDWLAQYAKVKNLRPEIRIDPKTQQLIVTGLTGLK